MALKKKTIQASPQVVTKKGGEKTSVQIWKKELSPERDQPLQKIWLRPPLRSMITSFYMILHRKSPTD